ncbi:hypothetical protein L0337_29740 [candidate division KSB1 bacterium]|nr:hypothetical protein [candidate division KSB1 bacterium]
MKPSNIFLAVLYLALAGCSPNATEPPQENLGPVYLTVDKSIYSPEDTVLVTLRNDSEESVFLGGCSALFLATKTDTGWNEQPTKICVWEGIIQKISPNSIYQEKYEAKYFRAAHKFVAPVGLGCQEGMPTGQAKCTRWEKIYSQVFSVSGYENAAGNLEIRAQKVEYTWGPEDLGASRQIEATVFNHSERTYYAMLGDGFNSSLDQETLFVAEGTGGFIELNESEGSWRAMPRSLLFEGTRFVALRPQKTYRLLADLGAWRGNETGQFRIKVEYFDRNDPPPGTTPKVDYSHAFTISAP